MRAEGWAELVAWHVERGDETPLFRQIYLQVRAAILSRTLRPGTKLPSTRQLATRLGVARASVIAAYDQLLAEGYLDGRVGSGSYVSSDLPEPFDRRAPARERQAAAAARRDRPMSAVFEQAFELVAHSTSEGEARPFTAARTLVDARTTDVWRSHQFPLGDVLSMPRRMELLAWARESGAFVIEDDYHSEYQYSGRPLASLQGLDEADRVIYVGTLNKVLFPGLRMGYAVVPQPLVRAFVGARYLMDRQPSSLYQAWVTGFMDEGHFAAHIRRMRILYRDQRDTLVAQLARRTSADLTVKVPSQGMHLVAYLRDGISDIAIEDAARRNGVVVRAISRMYHKAPARSGLLLGFTGFRSRTIGPAVARLAEAVQQSRRTRQSA